MIRSYNHSGVHTLHSVTIIASPIDEVWAFFSDPANLSRMTPGEMNFEITNPLEPEPMREGQVITYRISVFKWLRVNWVTEITHVVKPSFFIDEQRRGPYSMWHHEHSFRSLPGGTEMTDHVVYRIAPGIIGRMANSLLIRRKLEQIFRYRSEMALNIFGRVESPDR